MIKENIHVKNAKRNWITGKRELILKNEEIWHVILWQILWKWRVKKLSINYLNWSNKKVATLNRPVTTEEIAELLKDILRNIQSKIVSQLNS